MGVTKRPRETRTLQGGGSSNPRPQEEEHTEVDPFYTPEQQASRLAKYSKRKSTTIRYVNMYWFITEGFRFPKLLEYQGLNNFLELEGVIYPNLVREFYANFRHKDDICMSMIKGKSFEMNKDIFLDIGSLACDGIRIGDCDNVWRRFDPNAVYEKWIRNPALYERGTTKKAGLFSVEDRLLHYLIVYSIVPRLLNLAQPTNRDLQLMFAIKKKILFDWPSEILRHMYLIANSDKKPMPLAYSIFISRIVDYLNIDTSGEVIEEVTKTDNLIDDRMLRKMFMIRSPDGWIFEVDQVEDVDEMQVDSGNEEDEQPVDDFQAASEPTTAAPSDSAITIAHLNAMEQRINARIDERIQGMENRIMEAIRLQTEDLTAQYYRMHL